MSLDQERVTRLIGSLRSSVRLLSELSAIPEAEFIRDAHKLSSAKNTTLLPLSKQSLTWVVIGFHALG